MMIRSGLTVLMRNQPGLEAMASAAVVRVERTQRQWRERKAEARAKGVADARAGLSRDKARHGIDGISFLGHPYEWGWESARRGQLELSLPNDSLHRPETAGDSVTKHEHN